MITDRRIFTTKWSLCRSFHFTARINSKSFPCLYASYKKPTQIFRNVRWPLFGKPSTPLCRLADRHGRKADPNWKLKISNTSYNGDITHSQARDTRHRWMQEVNSLITDSGPLRADYCIVSRRINQKFKKLYLRNHNRCFFHVFAQTTHVVAAPHGFACVGIHTTWLYIPRFIEIRSGVSEPQESKFALSHYFGYCHDIYYISCTFVI